MKAILTTLVGGILLAACVPDKAPPVQPPVAESPTAQASGAPCAAALVRPGSMLSQDIARLGAAAKCTDITVGQRPGLTLAGGGVVERGADTPRLLALVTRSEQPFGDSAEISGHEDQVVAGMTGGALGDAERLSIQSNATVSGHRIELAGFTTARSGDPLPYACVVASDRTSRTMVAALCRSVASGRYLSVAQSIVDDDLPAILW